MQRSRPVFSSQVVFSVLKGIHRASEGSKILPDPRLQMQPLRPRCPRWPNTDPVPRSSPGSQLSRTHHFGVPRAQHCLRTCLPLRNRPGGPTNQGPRAAHSQAGSAPHRCAASPNAKQRTPRSPLFRFMMLVWAQRPFLRAPFELECLTYQTDHPSCGSSGFLLFSTESLTEMFSQAGAAGRALRPASGDPAQGRPKYGDVRVGGEPGRSESIAPEDPLGCG